LDDEFLLQYPCSRLLILAWLTTTAFKKHPRNRASLPGGRPVATRIRCGLVNVDVINMTRAIQVGSGSLDVLGKMWVIGQNHDAQVFRRHIGPEWIGNP